MIVENEENRISLIGEEPPESRALVANPTPANLLAIALLQGAGLDQLERLYAMQVRYEQDEARKAYVVAFAAFKAEAVRILKNKQVSDGPLKGKGYAELHAVVNAITPALSKHGLAASWHLSIDDKDWIQVTCTIRHEKGHSESVAMGGPPDTGGAKNAIQARASTVTYLERYTLKAICGIAEQDQDDDGQGGAGGGAPEAADDETVLDEWRAKAAEGLKVLEAHYTANVPTDDFWKRHGPSLRKAAKAFDADAKKAASEKAAS